MLCMSLAVSPIEKESPGTWLEDNVAKPELSFAVGSVQEITAESEPGSVEWPIFWGTLFIVGFSVSVRK